MPNELTERQRRLLDTVLILAAIALGFVVLGYVATVFYTFGDVLLLFFLSWLLSFALLPLITGVSYELIRFAAKRQGTVLGLITAPGLWLQRITTQPPDDTEVAVAIHALEGAMTLEAKQGGELVIA